MIFIAVLLALMIASFLIWWLIIATEGVYLGRRVVIALYNLYAGRYDRIKEFDEYADIALLSQPILSLTEPQTDPLILDIATGTGRLPLIMARNARFGGHVLGLDASKRMLERAGEKVAAEHFEQYITLLHHDASQLPFPDCSFDVVTCLEALEFMPDPRVVLGEMVRVLRPGGLLLTTIRIDTRWLPNRTWSEARMRAELESLTMHEIRFAIWQEDYSQVWARKAGDSPEIGRPGLADLQQHDREVAII